MKPAGPVARKKDYSFEHVSWADAAGLIKQHHYSGSCANTGTLCHGLRRRADDVLVGASLWMPPTAGAAKGLAALHLGSKEKHREVLVLSRLVVAPGEPANTAGLLLGASTRAVWCDERWTLLVTYADQGQGHEGTVYRATGWRFDGPVAARSQWWLGGRLVSAKATRNKPVTEMEALGAERRKTSKLRFTKSRWLDT